MSALPGTVISSLPPAASLDGREIIPIVQGGTTKSGTASQIAGTAKTFTAYTVATLPISPAGTIAYVTDGNSGLAWGVTVINSGAGATKYLVWFNGVNWTVVGK